MRKGLEYLWGLPQNDSFFHFIETKREEKNWKDVRIGSIRITKAKVKEFKFEADVILKTELWSLLMNSMKTDAYHKIYERSQTIDDIIAQKILLYWIQTVQKTLTQIKEIDTISD